MVSSDIGTVEVNTSSDGNVHAGEFIRQCGNEFLDLDTEDTGVHSVKSDNFIFLYIFFC